MDNLEDLKKRIDKLKHKIYNHKLFCTRLNIQQVRYFMESHIFSVWGFMSILKSIQFNLSTTTLPWTPTDNTRNGLTNFINEIVLSEESDFIEGIGYTSHFEIYLDAMKEINADTSQILLLLKNIKDDGYIYEHVNKLNILDEVKAFIKFDMETSISGNLPKLVGSFTLGREKVIPNMFEHIILSVNDVASTSKFITYLNRHIEVDGDRHGPLSSELLEKICTSDQDMLLSYQFGIKSLKLRLKIWDKISEDLCIA